MLPEASTVTPTGILIPAFAAGPPSPELPPPTTVLTIFEDIFRTRLLSVSATYRDPDPSRATFEGRRSRVAVGARPLPLKPAVPLPTTVVMIPPVTLRTRLLPESAIYRFVPPLSTATPLGPFSEAVVAVILSPLNP